jgi:hypothetical protein
LDLALGFLLAVLCWPEDGFLQQLWLQLSLLVHVNILNWYGVEELQKE